jgi:hypothetical protein
MTKTPELESDRRGAPRRRVLKGGKISFGDTGSVFDCTVKDLSTTGARLSLGHFQPLPKRFLLTINGLGTIRCEVVRALGNDYGVRFVTDSDTADTSD